MRQLFLIIFIFLITACSSPQSTPPLQPVQGNASPPPIAPTQRSAPAPSVVAATTQPSPRTTPNEPNSPTPQPSNHPTIQPPSPQATDIPTATAIPSPTQVPAQLIQLMDGACCASPSWYSDSETILFIDKPNANAPTGIYSVNFNAPNQSKLWSERIAFYTREFDYAQIPEQAGTRLIRVSDDKEIRVKNGGRTVSFSPDRTRIVWTESRETFPTENRVSNIMLAPIDFDGAGVGEAQRVTQMLRGGVSSWLDNNRLLMNGRLSRESEDSTTFVYDLTTGKQTEIFTAERSRLTTISRDSAWIAYVIVNDKDAARNGLAVIRPDGTDAKKIEMFGAAQWRDGTHLIIATFEMDTPTHSFFEYDVETGETRRLTPPDKPFKVASGDWSISPDGAKIVFVNAADNNLWVWKLP